MAVIVNEDECIACAACADACPTEALSVDDVAKVDEETCIDCGACVGTCPIEALSL